MSGRPRSGPPFERQLAPPQFEEDESLITVIDELSE